MKPESRVVFVGAVVGEAECLANPVCNAAGNKFQRNFIRAFGNAASQPMDVVAYEPAVMFPAGRRVFYPGRVAAVDADLQPVTYAGFVNLPALKQISQALTLFIELARWQRRNRHRHRTMILFNVFAPHALAVLAARALFGGHALAIVADLPHGLYEYKGFWGVLEKVDLKVQTWSISRFDGLIALTEMIRSDFAPSVPATVLEGAIDDAEYDEPVRCEESCRVVLFSGTLNEVNGTRLMLDAFRQIQGPEYRLRIFGRGPLEDLVLAAAAADSRIEFMGHRANREVLHEQRRATVLLNPRPTHHPVTRYTFPSKLLEYMVSGRPVITTPLPGIPPDYYPFLHLLIEETPDALARLIEYICELAPEAQEVFGAAARDFVRREKTWSVQGERAHHFVHGVMERTR